jgi:hypothetical protein
MDRWGHPSKYDGVDQIALQNFKGMHDRVRDGKAPSIEWPRTKEGYVAFLAEIGPKPQEAGRWSIGRKRHELGYVSGNVQWELHRFNSVKRRGTKFNGYSDPVVVLKQVKFRKGTKEWLEHQRQASLKRWSKPDSKERLKAQPRGYRARFVRAEL